MVGVATTTFSRAIDSWFTGRTRAIIVPHMFGLAADLDRLTALGVPIIEDCAQAHLARYQGKLVGTFGNAATFSFYPGKNLGAYGDAGCLVTNDSELAEWTATYARHGGKGEHVMEGINSKQYATRSTARQFVPEYNNNDMVSN